MINSVKRNPSQRTSYIEQKQPLSNCKRSGNVIIKSNKLSQSPITKYGIRQSSYGNQNAAPSSAMRARRKNYQGQEDSIQNVNQFDPVCNARAEANIEQKCKKQSDKRNRQFVIKVQNINKMHEQINSLLKYVKNGDSKSVCRLKQNQNKPMTDKSIQNIIKERMNTSVINDKISRYQKNYDQSLILPVTQNNQYKQYNQRQINADQRAITMYSRMPQNQYPAYHYQKEQNKRQKVTAISKQNGFQPGIAKKIFKINDKDKQTEIIKTPQNRSMIKQNIPTLTQTSKMYRQEFHKNYGINGIREGQNNEQLQATQRKNKYVYNFDSKQNQIKQFVNKSQLKRKQGMYDKNAIDYDYQISKVKQRIQSSQQITKKMQQKYLIPHPHNRSTTSQTSVDQDIKISGLDQKIRERVNKSIDQHSSKNRIQRKKYNNVEEYDYNDPRQKNQFQIKVYPCKSRIQPNCQQQKQQVKRLIAAKLSQQVKLDQKLRDARQIFNFYKSQDKWKLLQHKLEQLGFSYTQQQLQMQLKISSNQSNPFQSQNISPADSIDILGHAFINSQQFWEKKLCKFIQMSRLINCGYQVRQMDLDQRGYLTVEDLVCFINLYSSNFFRNRDLICLFKRIMAFGKNSNGIQYQTFLNIISSQ